MYPYCRKIIEEMASDFEETSNTVRREKDVMEYHFQEPQDLTEEELKKKNDELAKAKADFFKKIKKKPRSGKNIMVMILLKC